MAAAFLLGLMIIAPAESASASPYTQVICTVKQFGGLGEYRSTPRACAFHPSGQEGADEYFDVPRVDKIHWRRWGIYSAEGFGLIPPGQISYWQHARIRLNRPVENCGRFVFSNAVFWIEGHAMTFPLDDYLTEPGCE